jgi:hypothetical protein
LLVSALCLRHVDAGVLLLSVDLLFLDPDFVCTVRTRIAEATGIAEAGICIACTHTHSGPVTVDMLAWRDDVHVPPPNPDYMLLLAEALLRAAREAVRTLQGAELAWTTASALGVGGNRLDPHGITDSEVGLLAVRAKSTRHWLALVPIYGMHPTVLHEDSTRISADFPGATRAALREAYGDALVVLYCTAPCGNQSPRHVVSAPTFSEADRLGRLLAERMVSSLSRLDDSMFSDQVVLAAQLGTIQATPTSMPPVAEAISELSQRRAVLAALMASHSDPGSIRTAECAVFGAEETVTLANAQAHGELASLQQRYQTVDVQVLRIHQSLLAGWPCEIFTEYALALKAQSPHQVFPVSLANGHLQGYIVTDDAVRAGGYEAATRVFEPATGQRLLAKTHELITDIFNR